MNDNKRVGSSLRRYTWTCWRSSFGSSQGPASMHSSSCVVIGSRRVALPPVGIEPTPSAPEADALSAELRGRSRMIVVQHQHRRTLVGRSRSALADAAVSAVAT